MARISVVTPNLREEALRLQPGKYITEMVKHLQTNGHSTTVITDTGRGAPGPVSLNGARVQLVKSTRVQVHFPNDELYSTVKATKPDILLWGVGQSSFWHLRWPPWIRWPTLCLFTAPIYHPGEITRLGLQELLSNTKFYGFYLISSMAPGWMARRTLNHPTVSSVIVLSHTVQARLLEQGIHGQKIVVNPPGLDPPIQEAEAAYPSTSQNKLVRLLYFGSPQRYRGADVAIQATAKLHDAGVPLRLTILSRKHDCQYDRDEQTLKDIVAKYRLGEVVEIKSGYLPPNEVQRYLDQADMVLLPFKIIPSDMPLTVLEAMRHGKPVVASAIGSIDELLAEGRGLTVPPNQASDLADAITLLIDHPEKRQYMGKKAQEFTGTWPGWEETGRVCETVIQDALNGW